MKTEKRSIKIWLAFALVLGETGLWAQSSARSFDARRLDIPRDLDDGWVVHSGDDPAMRASILIIPTGPRSICTLHSTCLFKELIRRWLGTGSTSRSIRPRRASRSVLVIGDVAGKGLPAAMLVSVMVGAIRAAAEFTHAPEEILAGLNERLLGRSWGGFSTALAAYFAPDGAVEIANAGHLSPYIDGKELELPGALPLGILGRSNYEVRRVLLGTGSRITSYSDGVVEAQNAKGELFGFDRSQQIATQPATEIAAAAKRYGQSDDITVVAVTRTILAAINAAA